MLEINMHDDGMRALTGTIQIVYPLRALFENQVIELDRDGRGTGQIGKSADRLTVKITDSSFEPHDLYAITYKVAVRRGDELRVDLGSLRMEA